MSEDEYFEEEEFEEEAEAVTEEAEEARAEGEMPLQELSKMMDIIDLMRKTMRGEIEEEEYKVKLNELLATKEPSRMERASRSRKKTGKKGKKTPVKKAS